MIPRPWKFHNIDPGERVDYGCGWTEYGSWRAMDYKVRVLLGAAKILSLLAWGVAWFCIVYFN